MSSEEDGIVFKKNSGDDSTEDIWDDTLLIEAYDRAVGAVQNAIKSKADASDSDLSRKGRKSKKRNSKKKQATKRDWKVGDACRAIFSEDGVVYEADIIDINYDTRRCTIRFIGYLNEEQVYLNELLKSQPHYRKIQARACLEEYPCHDFDQPNGDMDWKDLSDSASNSGKRMKQKYEWHHKRTHTHYQSRSHGLPSPSYSTSDFGPPKIPIIPPPPPISEMEELNEDDESLTSMLISWYMSGYHTGYYQGLKNASANKTQHKHGQTKPSSHSHCCSHCG